MILYADTSALVKLYVGEVGSAEVRRAVSAARLVATSRVAYPEARAALARRRREGGLSVAGHRTAVAALARDLGRYVVVEVSEEVARRAGDLAERHALRGFDALHVASAIELGAMLGESPTFLGFDARQSNAATAEGLGRLP